jgi:hypothetical protein
VLLSPLAGCDGDGDGVKAARSAQDQATATVTPRVSAPGVCRFAPFYEVTPAWRITARDRRVQQYLQSVLTNRYGRITKVDPGPRLAHGLIGLAIDAAAHGFTAIVDPAMIDVAELEGTLKRAARAKEAELGPGRKVPVRVQAGCHSAAEVREAYDVIREVQTKYPRTLSAVSAVPESSAYRVVAQPGSPGAPELRERLGDRVIVEEIRIIAG